MSTSGGDRQTDDGSFNLGSQPFVWVLVPLGILGIAAIAYTFLRYKRRNYQRRGFNMNALDLESMPPNRARRPAHARWQWAGGPGQGAGRRLGLGVGSREEGLNELGEAPPAYTPPRKASDGDAELNDRDPQSPEVAQTTSTPATEPTNAQEPNSSTLPTYVEAAGSEASNNTSVPVSAPQDVATPSPAHLPNR